MKIFKYLFFMFVFALMLSSCDTTLENSVLDPAAETTLEIQKGAVDTVQIYTKNHEVYILKEGKLIGKAVPSEDVEDVLIIHESIFVFFLIWFIGSVIFLIGINLE